MGDLLDKVKVILYGGGEGVNPGETMTGEPIEKVIINPPIPMRNESLQAVIPMQRAGEKKTKVIIGLDKDLEKKDILHQLERQRKGKLVTAYEGVDLAEEHLYADIMIARKWAKYYGGIVARDSKTNKYYVAGKHQYDAG